MVNGTGADAIRPDCLLRRPIVTGIIIQDLRKAVELTNCRMGSGRTAYIFRANPTLRRAEKREALVRVGTL